MGFEQHVAYQAMLNWGHSPLFAEGYARGYSEGHVRGLGFETIAFAENFAEGFVEGALVQARKMIQDLGSIRFGPPSAAVVATLEAITELDKLETLGLGLLRAANWQELLDLLLPSAVPPVRRSVKRSKTPTYSRQETPCPPSTPRKKPSKP